MLLLSGAVFWVTIWQSQEPKKKKKKFHRDTLYAASPQNYRGIPIIHRPWSTKLFQ